jgi:hypothetical protein
VCAIENGYLVSVDELKKIEKQKGFVLSARTKKGLRNPGKGRSAGVP